jgi:hypothetical protein
MERSNSWTMRARRNARDYERLMSHAEAHIQWAFITLMTRRLAGRHRRTKAALLSTPATAACRTLRCRSEPRPLTANRTASTTPVDLPKP